MSNITTVKGISAHELALVQNDLSKLNPQERLSLYNKTCESLGLNPLTQPFGYIEFRGGKISLYAKKDATDQLRKLHGVSVEIVSKETIGDNFVVIAKAKDSQGRVDEDMGSVSIKGLSGEALGNAMMKSITKAKRRVTLSICGLGILDETEVETVPGAKDVTESKPVQEVKDTQPNGTQIEPPKKSILEKVVDAVVEPLFSEEPKKTKVPNLALGIYKMKAGRFDGKALKDLSQIDLKKYVQQCELHAQETGKELPLPVQENIWTIKEYLGLE